MGEHPFGEVVRGDHKVGRTELQCPFAPCSPEAAKMN